MLDENQNVESKTPHSKKIRQLVKIALPHVALYVLLFLYLMAGAWAFASIENHAERMQQLKKLERIDAVYRQISEEMLDECNIKRGKEQELFNEQLYESLSRLSSFMEGKDFKLSPNYRNNLEDMSEDEFNQLMADVDQLLPPRWNVMASVLYALSILTTTGYAAAVPMTPLGQWFSVGYGLIGIPLMILAAVDIGRFLSDVVLSTYTRIERAAKKVSSLFGFSRTTNSVISHVETKALKVLHNTRRRSLPRKHIKKENTTAEYTKIDTEVEHDTHKSAKDHPKVTKKRLPLSVNAAILLMFCMLGGVVYVAAAGNQKTFIEGFFVTFNLVANLTMSEIPSDISHVLTLIYIFIFVTFGLAVLSMCADLAASELKYVFLNIHYFGRKINWKRKVVNKSEEQMEVEVKELVKIISQIRAKYPEKQQITSFDILKYVQELNGGYMSGLLPYGANPYRTFNIFLMQQHRRDTIAFMPQSIEALKFADEMDAEEANDWLLQQPFEPGTAGEILPKESLSIHFISETEIQICFLAT
ncbi:ion channel domain-containing protein [Ditylenchus destructor]|nr:ion channel domain-containing protein [Ditylenchus destructor]